MLKRARGRTTETKLQVSTGTPAREQLGLKGSAPHVDSCRCAKMLPTVLSVIAGSADVTSLLIYA